VRVSNAPHPDEPGDKIVWNGQIGTQAGLKGGGKNAAGTFDPQRDGFYPDRGANNRPLYSTEISESSLNSKSKKVYASKMGPSLIIL